MHSIKLLKGFHKEYDHCKDIIKRYSNKSFVMSVEDEHDKN